MSGRSASLDTLSSNKDRFKGNVGQKRPRDGGEAHMEHTGYIDSILN